MPATEMALRLAHVHSMLSRIKVDDDGQIAEEHTAGVLSALDYGLRGDPGCVEHEDFERERQAAYRAHAHYLGLP